MRPLVLDNEVLNKINSLKSYAEKHKISVDDILDTINKQMKPVGDYKEYTITISIGYRIVYSIEEQVIGDVKHLSNTVNENGVLPSPTAVEMIMKEFEFKESLDNCKVFLEQISENRKAVNILELIK